MFIGTGQGHGFPVLPLGEQTRVIHGAPAMYRLGRRPDGQLVLQGYFTWREQKTSGGDWRDLPTVDLPAQETSRA